MPRFVLLRHECPPDFKPSHWDFMLEAEGVLRTWELHELPTSWLAAIAEPHSTETRSVAATRLADHRMVYLDYEGPLTENRGSVSRVAAGSFEVIDSSSQHLAVALRGAALQGTAELLKSAEQNRWQLTVQD
jgi:hypothetical protein